MRVLTLGRLTALVALLIVLAVPGSVSATHSWNGYHWARQANPFTLKIGDNVGGAWDGVLNTTVSDWSKSTVLDLTKVGGGTSPRSCRPTSGRVEVCNARYGYTGWLGVAQIWISGSHITQGSVKLNDTYFASSPYNTTPWRNLVSCQEVGHTLGLDHQDEDFANANLGTCMDYTSDPTGTAGTNGTLDNEHPNQHDYDELVTIYTHLDGTTTVGAATSSRGVAGEGGSGPADWGEVVRSDSRGRPILFDKNVGRGRHILTWVVWEG